MSAPLVAGKVDAERFADFQVAVNALHLDVVFRPVRARFPWIGSSSRSMLYSPLADLSW